MRALACSLAFFRPFQRRAAFAGFPVGNQIADYVPRIE
jgi:hypothetical protein